MKIILQSTNYMFLSIFLYTYCLFFFSSCSKSVKHEIKENIKVYDNKIGFFNENQLLFIYESKDQPYYLIETPYFTMLEKETFEELVPVFGESKYRKSNVKGISPDITFLNKYVNLRSKYIATNINDVIRLINYTQVTFPESKHGHNRIKLSLYPQNTRLINNLSPEIFHSFIEDRIRNLEISDKLIREYIVNRSRNEILIKTLLLEKKQKLVDSIPSELDRYYRRFQTTSNIFREIYDVKFNNEDDIKHKSFSYIVIPDVPILIAPIYRFEIDSAYKGFRIRKFLLNDEIMYNDIQLVYM